MKLSLVLIPAFALALSACGGATGPTSSGPTSDAGAAPDPFFAQTSFTFPQAGTPNDNGAIGPFCCTGRTATVTNTSGVPVGHIYFFDFRDGYNTSDTTSVAGWLGIEVSGMLRPEAPDENEEVQETIGFYADTMKVGDSRSIAVGGLVFTATIEHVDLSTVAGHQEFDMGTIAVRVDVSRTTQ